MNKQEVSSFITERYFEHSTGVTYGYTSGDLDIENPERNITELEFRVNHLALLGSLLDVFVKLGLIDE